MGLFAGWRGGRWAKAQNQNWLIRLERVKRWAKKPKRRRVIGPWSPLSCAIRGGCFGDWFWLVLVGVEKGEVKWWSHVRYTCEEGMQSFHLLETAPHNDVSLCVIIINHSFSVGAGTYQFTLAFQIIYNIIYHFFFSFCWK